MKKAFFSLIVIALLAIIGGALAFKVSRNGTPNLAIYRDDTYTTTATRIGTNVYTATIPYCVTIPVKRTQVGPLVSTFSTTTNPFITVIATLEVGTATTTFPYVYCVPFTTRTTLLD